MRSGGIALTCFALDPFGETRRWRPCQRDATREIGGQHYCAGHAERIVDAVTEEVTLVYFAERGGTIKIGISREPRERVRALGARLLATEPGGRRRESHLHLLFAEHCIGGEWFFPATEIVDYLNGLLEKQSVGSGLSPTERAEASGV